MFNSLQFKSNTSKMSIFLILCIVLQAIAPLGFMPGNIAAGEAFFTVCPSQQPQLFAYLQLSHTADTSVNSSTHHDHFMHQAHQINDEHQLSHSTQQISNDCQWAPSLFVALLFVFLLFTFTPVIHTLSLYTRGFYQTSVQSFSLIRAPPIS